MLSTAPANVSGDIFPTTCAAAASRAGACPSPTGSPSWTVRLAFVTVFRRATKVPTILIPRRFESRLKPLRFENRKLRETLGWTPPLDYKQCLARTYGPVPTPAEAPAPWPSGTAAST